MINRGEMPWDERERARLSMHDEFDRAFAADYVEVNVLLLKAGGPAMNEKLP